MFLSLSKLRTVVGLAAAAALTASLTACGVPAAPVEMVNPPTMAPDQSISEACAVSSAEVDAVTQEVKDRIDEAGKAVASGEMPDLDGIFGTISGALEGVTEGVSNPEVAAALGEVQAGVAGLGDIKAPDSLLGAPGYVADLTGQLAKIQSAGESLRALCLTE